MIERKRPRGRPPIPTKERKAKNFTFRGRSDLHEKLRIAAKAGARTVSDEIERRLSASFDATTAADEMGGLRLFGLLKAIASVMQNAGQMASAMNAGEIVQDDSWLENPTSFAQAAAAARRFLELCAPSPEPHTIETGGLPTGSGIVLQAAYQNLGAHLAEGLAREIAKKGRVVAGPTKARAEQLRVLLGDEVVENLRSNIEGDKS